MKFYRPLFLLLILAQLALFWQYAHREIVWAYPANFDQASYLVTDYTLYRDALENGPWIAVRHFFEHPQPTGVMLPLQNSMLHFFAGPGRQSDLLLNFGYFTLLETMVFVTARWLTGRQAFGWLGCGLLLLQQAAFLGSGGLLDCRIDFIAYCLYGVFVCLVIRSDGLRERRWLVAAAVCSLLLVSFRFVTFSYLLGFCTTLFTSLLALYLRWRRCPEARAGVVLAMKRTAVLGVSFALAGGTLIALNWHVIHDYYVVGHLTGSEKHVRALEMGIRNLRGHLTYYGASLFKEQLGGTFITVWLGLAALAVGGWFVSHWRKEPGQVAIFDPRWLIQGIVIGASLFSPWFILTLDESKSPIVANVLSVPILLLLFVVIAGLHRQSAYQTPGTGTTAAYRVTMWNIIAAIVLVMGGCNWTSHLMRAGYFSQRRASVEQIGAFYDTVGEQARSLDLEAPVLAVDGVYDWVVPNAIIAGLYERTGQWLNVRGSLLGNSIFALSREQIFTTLNESDLVILTSFPKVGPYPVFDSIRPFAAEMQVWCAAHLMPVGVFAINDGQAALYVKPKVALEGLSGEWITPAGLHAKIPGEVLDWMRATGKKSLVMEGRENPYLQGQPVVSARGSVSGAASQNMVCPVDFTLPEPGVYRIRLDLNSVLSTLAAGASANVAIHFDGAFFVPRERGINEDTRQLVEVQPTVFRFQ